MMRWTDRASIALRYTFALGKGNLSTFLSSLSMLGLVLAIALLIVVLSVMNGFDREMRERILALVPHLTIFYQHSMGDWPAAADIVAAHPDVDRVVPFTQFDALFMRGNHIETARGIGIDFKADEPLLGYLAETERQVFQEDDEGLILGVGLATRLGAVQGDELTLVVPAANSADLSQQARFATLRLSAVVETGTELDQALALIHLPMASRLAGHEGAVTGLRVHADDIFAVSRTGWELVNNLPRGHYSTNWTMTHGNLYSAIQLSRDLVSILLFSIIAVASFNVVSSLVLVVFDKQGNIAILRTVGATPGDIIWVFVLQGALIGLVGIGVGSVFGALGSLLVPDLVAALEALLDIRFLNTDVYPVSFLPVDFRWEDVVIVAAIAFSMCVLAALYPALRASRLAPAIVLNQDRG
jgi:lipoprotein-releasing system permease protein